MAKSMSSDDSRCDENGLFGVRFAEVCDTAEPARIQRLLNISYQAAKNYLNGRLPDPRVLLTIAERTPYSLHWLLTGEGEKFALPARDDGDTPLLARQIGELIRQEVSSAVDHAMEKAQKPGFKTIVLRTNELKSETEKELTKQKVRRDR